MPKGIVDLEEIIEKIQKFSEVNSEENNKILQQILSKVNDQGEEVKKLTKEVAELKKKLEAGNINDAEVVYVNGWRTLVTEYSSDGQTTNNIDQKVHQKSEVDKAHKLLAKIKSETDLSKLPSDNEIKSYDESKVPSSINYGVLIGERDNKTKSLFKSVFEGSNPKEIKSKITSYQGVENIDVLKIKQLDIDNEITKADNLLNDISKQTSLHDLIPTYKQEEIKALKDELLPPNKKSTDIINKREEIKEYDPLTPEILDGFFKACEGLGGKVLQDGEEESLDKVSPNYKNEKGEPTSFLKSLKAFEIDEVEAGISAKEGELPKETRGTYLLPLFYKMNNYNKDAPDFCDWKRVKKVGESGKETEINLVIDTTTENDINDPQNPKKYTDATIKELKELLKDGLKGHLAIGTGVGKTTKTINCLVYMMKKLFNANVVLICPTTPLVQKKEEYTDENGVKKERYKSHGTYKVEMNKLVDGLSIMEPKYFNAYLAATLCDTSLLDSSKGGNKIPQEEKNKFEANVAKIKDYVIPDGTLIVFDEADFAIPEYQEMIRDTIILTNPDGKAKYRVLKMSATFKGKPFSITSSYPIESYYLGGLKTGTDLKLEDRLGKGKSLLFLKSIKNKQISKALDVLKKGSGKTGNGVCHVVYDSTYESFMEGISFGLPKGSVGIGDTRYGRGFTPDIQNTFSSGLIEISALGAFCRYASPETQPYPVAEGGQQRGRGGRIQEGF
nr:2923_t:CDS:2 [Entrophospora candida]